MLIDSLTLVVLSVATPKRLSAAVGGTCPRYRKQKEEAARPKLSLKAAKESSSFKASSWQVLHGNPLDLHAHELHKAA